MSERFPEWYLANITFVRGNGNPLSRWLAVVQEQIGNVRCDGEQRLRNRTESLLFHGRWQFPDEPLAVMEIRACRGVFQRPVTVTAIDRVGGLDDRREADAPGTPGWRGRQGRYGEGGFQFESAIGLEE